MYTGCWGFSGCFFTGCFLGDKVMKTCHRFSPILTSPGTDLQTNKMPGYWVALASHSRSVALKTFRAQPLVGKPWILACSAWGSEGPGGSKGSTRRSRLHFAWGVAFLIGDNPRPPDCSQPAKLRTRKLRIVDPQLLGNPPWTLEFPPVKSRICSSTLRNPDS